MDDDSLDIRDVPAYAADRRWQDVLRVLHKHPLGQLSIEDRSLLLAALSYYGHPKAVTMLLQAGAAPNIRNLGLESIYASNSSAGSTPLGETVLGSAERRYPTLQAMRLLL